MIDIRGLNKAAVLKALYDNSHVQGLGYLQAVPEGVVTLEYCEKLLKESQYFDYLCGRVLKVDLSGSEFDETLYDRDCGKGAAQKAVDSIKNNTTTKDENKEPDNEDDTGILIHIEREKDSTQVNVTMQGCAGDLKEALINALARITVEANGGNPPRFETIMGVNAELLGAILSIQEEKIRELIGAEDEEEWKI